MNTSELLVPLCSAWSWPCCTGREPLFSPISAPRFCTPEHFVSEEAVCHLPLCSALHDMKLSTWAEWSAFTIRAFVSRIGNKRLLQQIYFCTRSLEKTKDSFTCRSLQPWKMRKSTELGIRPTSQQNYFPQCPLCFTWCSWMSLKRLLKYYYFWNSFYFLAGQSL